MDAPIAMPPMRGRSLLPKLLTPRHVAMQVNSRSLLLLSSRFSCRPRRRWHCSWGCTKTTKTTSCSSLLPRLIVVGAWFASKWSLPEGRCRRACLAGRLVASCSNRIIFDNEIVFLSGVWMWVHTILARKIAYGSLTREAQTVRVAFPSLDW